MALVVKNSPVNAGDTRNMGLIPESERFPGGGCGNPLQYSCLESPKDRGAWQATVHGVAQSDLVHMQVAQLVKNPLQCGRPWFNPWDEKIRWRRHRLPTPVFLGFPGGSAGKESACNAGDLGLIPGLRRSPREGNGYLLQYSGLENFVDFIVHGVTKCQTRLSNFTFTFTQEIEQVKH